jgi:dihydropteroate synthase
MTTVFPARALFTIPLPDGSHLRLGERALVMGVLNVTPDSFGDTVRQLDSSAAIEAGLRMELAGADIIDVGGESTRPGAEVVSARDECDRIVPVIEGLAARARVPISVDTYKADVARAALAAGARMVNDISGLRFDPAIGRVAADAGAALIVVHSRGRSKTMYDEAVYGDIMADVIRELRDNIAAATAAGVPRDRIIVDPGIGFAKRPAHSYGVLARLPKLAAALDRPVLAGPSRKSFMRDALDGRAAADRDWGTAAAVTAAVLAGAHIVRVHAVAEMAQVVRVADEIRRHSRQP